MVYYRPTPNPASEDFAKQLLVLIGTLVTSVAGFYFGSQAVSDAQDASGLGPPPTLHGVDPGKIEGGGERKLTITGNDLNQVTQAQIASGNVQITDPNVVSNARQVVAHFAVPPDAPKGPWDVVVIDKAGRSARLAGALNVDTPAPKSELQPVPGANPTS